MPLFLSLLWRETENDPALRQKALAGLRRYQQATRNDAAQHGNVHARKGNARLLHLGQPAAQQECPARSPVVLIPSLVNSHHILDLSERTSLAAHLRREGYDPWLIDWGEPDIQDGGLDIAQHIEQILLPLLRSIGRPPILVGYCLGGTIAIAAAQLLPASALVTIATPWHFERHPDDHRALIDKLWAEAKPLCEQLGYVPMEVLQSGFWALDPNRTVRKYAGFADIAEGSEQERAFLAVEDWANEGAPLSYAVGRDLFERLYAEDHSGRDLWHVGSEAIRPSALLCPSLSIRSSTDRIVPAASSPDLAEVMDSTLGHVGMIVSGRAPEDIWLRLSDWLSRHTR